jgi:hypothetical protein
MEEDILGMAHRTQISNEKLVHIDKIILETCMEQQY